MNNEQEQMLDLLSKQLDKNEIDKTFNKLGLSFNPFSQSGIAHINSTDYFLGKLGAQDSQTMKLIIDYIKDSLFSYKKEKDKYLSLVVRGDYGNGKTHTLLFIKYILEEISKTYEQKIKPYVIYIDNPGAKLSELIGAIIYQIGEENFKKYLWDVLLNNILKDELFRKELIKNSNSELFKIDLFEKKNLISHKGFLNTVISILPTNKRKPVQDLIKNKSITIFTSEFENSTIANYFYNLMVEDIGVNKIWEQLSNGTLKELEKKEVYIIRAIVKLIESNGFTDFYILVDEFENVTAGRLTKSEIDRYIINLRALIDKERNWCSVFAMTGQALSSLKRLSPPLYDRISGRIIDLKSIDEKSVELFVLKYLNLARKDSELIFPFDKNALMEITEQSLGNLRLFLKNCFNLIQRASETKDFKIIDTNFVKNNILKTEE